MQTILFTGGGSAGHVTPNIALIQTFKASGWKVLYAGSAKGMERGIIERLNIPYCSVVTGKLRRYFSWQTFMTPFAVLVGIIQAYFLCRRLKPNILFSKGGFVAFPIVVGAWLNRIPVSVHESDFTPGLANRLSFPFADRIFVTFPEVQKSLPAAKVMVSGSPIRESLYSGNRENGLRICGFKDGIPIVLVMGGGQGSIRINQAVRKILPQLAGHFQVAHICGQNKMDPSLISQPGYCQFEYLEEQLADLFACCDLIISRAGANSLYELLRLRKPHILIPLSRQASRGDQIINAQYFEQRGLSSVLLEENLTGEALLQCIENVYANKIGQEQRLRDFSLPDSNKIIYQELVQLVSNRERL